MAEELFCRTPLFTRPLTSLNEFLYNSISYRRLSCGIEGLVVSAYPRILCFWTLLSRI